MDELDLRNMLMNIRRSLAVTVVLAVVTAACGPPVTEPEARPEPEVKPIRNIGEKDIPNTKGDVSFQFYSTIHLDTARAPAAVEYSERQMKNFDGRVTSANAVVPAPFPENLYAKYAIGCPVNFPGDAILVTARLFVDDRVVQTEDIVFGENPHLQTQYREVDVIAQFDDIPASTLVHVELEATLYKDTDADTIDPETVERPEDETVIIYSNPLRIDFKS